MCNTIAIILSFTSDDLPIALFVVGICLAAVALMAGRTSGQRAFYFGIAGFLIVAVPVVGLGIALLYSPDEPGMPRMLARQLGPIGIVVGVIGGLIVGGIGAAIGGWIDR